MAAISIGLLLLEVTLLSPAVWGPSAWAGVRHKLTARGWVSSQSSLICRWTRCFEPYTDREAIEAVFMKITAGLSKPSEGRGLVMEYLIWKLLAQMTYFWPNLGHLETE